MAACVVVSNFSNPLGFSMSDARKQALVELLAARGIPLIEDDVYGELGFGVNRPSVAKAWDAAGGVTARQVTPGSAAAKAGIEPGDVLQAVNGAPVARATDAGR